MRYSLSGLACFRVKKAEAPLSQYIASWRVMMMHNTTLDISHDLDSDLASHFQVLLRIHVVSKIVNSCVQ